MLFCTLQSSYFLPKTGLRRAAFSPEDSKMCTVRKDGQGRKSYGRIVNASPIGLFLLMSTNGPGSPKGTGWQGIVCGMGR